MLIVCPSRPELLDSRPSWGTGQLNASSLTLAPLGSADAESLLRELLGSDAVPAHIAHRILAPAEGNPFFVEEMLAMLVEQGAIEERDGRWVETDRLATTSVPDSMHGVIAARLDLLESHEREALRRCSVMGRVFWPSAVGVDDDIVAALGRRAIVSEQVDSAFAGRREFMFKHALTHEVAYTTLPRYERGSLHRRVARWLGESVPDRKAETTELIAFHYEQALRWGDADEELRRCAFEAAARSWRRGSPPRCVLVRSAPSRAVGRARGVFQRARAGAPACSACATSTGRSTSEPWSAWRRPWASPTRPATRGCAPTLSACERARPGWPGTGAMLSKLRKRRSRRSRASRSRRSSLAPWLGSPRSRCCARFLARRTPQREAIEVAVRTGEPVAEANARINLFTARSAQGSVPPAATITSIVDGALDAGAQDEAARAVVNYLWSAALVGPLGPAEDVVKLHAPKLERGLSAEGYASYLQLSLAALVYVPAGRWAEADEVLAGGETTRATNRLVWLWLVTGQALRRGDLGLVDRHLPEFRAAALASEEPQRILPMASVALPRAMIANDATEARTLAEVIVDLRVTSNPMSFATLAIPRALAAIGDRERLEAVSSALAGPPGHEPAVVGEASLGLLAALDAALRGGCPHPLLD